MGGRSSKASMGNTVTSKISGFASKLSQPPHLGNIHLCSKQTQRDFVSYQDPCDRHTISLKNILERILGLSYLYSRRVPDQSERIIPEEVQREEVSLDQVQISKPDPEATPYSILANLAGFSLRE